jgi:hypothetical protein
VPDDQHALPVPASAHVLQEPADPRDRLPPALPVGVRHVQVSPPGRVQLCGRHPASPPGNPPVATPRSLSTVVECVSNTTLSAIGDQAGSG